MKRPTRLHGGNTPILPGIGDIVADRYRLKSVIAKGGMGVVMQAEHIHMKRDVAIKFLHGHLAGDDSLWQRFRREVHIAKELTHPNTVRLYDFGETNQGYLFLVMELLEGEEFKSVILREGPQSTQRVIDIGAQVLEGLAEAHAMSIIHRDLKPGNIFITKDRRNRDVAKILDFGVAKSLQSAQQSITSTGYVCGTAAYLAPETYLDDVFGKPVDIYAVGLILLEALFGRRVIDGSTMARTMVKHLRMPMILPPRLAATPLGHVILRALDKDPKQRYQDADEMLAALSAAESQTPDFTLTNLEIAGAFRAMEGAFKGEDGQAELSNSLTDSMPAHTIMLSESAVMEVDSDVDISRPATPIRDPETALTTFEELKTIAVATQPTSLPPDLHEAMTDPGLERPTIRVGGVSTAPPIPRPQIVNAPTKKARGGFVLKVLGVAALAVVLASILALVIHFTSKASEEVEESILAMPMEPAPALEPPEADISSSLPFAHLLVTEAVDAADEGQTLAARAAEARAAEREAEQARMQREKARSEPPRTTRPKTRTGSTQNERNDRKEATPSVDDIMNKYLPPQ